MPPTIRNYAQALATVPDASKKYLLTGNGFSIALKPDIFTYASLYDNADFSTKPYLPQVFEALSTRDFESVIKHLQSAAAIAAIYLPTHPDLAARLREDAAFIKEALVQAIAKRHPNRPFDITDAQYVSCRKFLAPFGHIFTLNYDVMLYWALMHTEVDDLDLMPDDGFRHPEENEEAPYVSWLQEQSATVHYLHGALHLFDNGHEIIKFTWSKTDIPIVEQIRTALAENKFPLFVAEGTSASKKERIVHNAYLHKALRSLEGCCKSANGAIVIYGHSLAENDFHILRCIANGGIANMLVGVFGDPNSPGNQVLFKNVEKLVARRISRRGARYPLTVTYYDAASAHVWDG
ncbi:DUF4917 family protein [Ferrovibrio sp.]|uniref:DUF4917 family protein n=1 Tax=Ferrovibrio sp. TaxID=1917215 RepID=UPI0035AFC488